MSRMKRDNINNWVANKRNIPHLVTYTWLLRLTGLFVGFSIFLFLYPHDGISVPSVVGLLSGAIVGFLHSVSEDKGYRDIGMVVCMTIGWIGFTVLFYCLSRGKELLIATAVELIMYIICIMLTKDR